MNCQGCYQKFNNQDRRPLILIECGHSVCQSCITESQQKFKQSSRKYRRISSESFPPNLCVSANTGPVGALSKANSPQQKHLGGEYIQSGSWSCRKPLQDNKDTASTINEYEYKIEVDVKKLGFKNSRTTQSSAMEIAESFPPPSSIVIPRRCTEQHSSSTNQEQKQQQIQVAYCPECRTEFNIARDLAQFPLNQALLSLAAMSGELTERTQSHNAMLVIDDADMKQKTPMKSQAHYRQAHQLEDDQTTLKNSSTHKIHSIFEGSYTPDHSRGARTLDRQHDFQSVKKYYQRECLHDSPIGICQTHGKEVQAFCADELQLLCIECLIDQKERHKEHQILNLQDAATIENQKLIEKSGQASKLQEPINGQIQHLKSLIVQLETQSREKRKQANELFEKIRQKLIEREAAVFKSISDNLDQETFSHRSQMLALERQLQSIDELNREAEQASKGGYHQNEINLQTLTSSSIRDGLIKQALKQVEFRSVKSHIPPLKEEEEVIKIIKSLRNNTSINHNRMISYANNCIQNSAQKKKRTPLISNRGAQQSSNVINGFLQPPPQTKSAVAISKPSSSSQRTKQPEKAIVPSKQQIMRLVNKRGGVEAIQEENKRKKQQYAVHSQKNGSGSGNQKYQPVQQSELNRQLNQEPKHPIRNKSPDRYFKMPDIESPPMRPPEIFSMGAPSRNASPSCGGMAGSSGPQNALQTLEVMKRPSSNSVNRCSPKNDQLVQPMVTRRRSTQKTHLMPSDKLKYHRQSLKSSNHQSNHPQHTMTPAPQRIALPKGPSHGAKSKKKTSSETHQHSIHMRQGSGTLLNHQQTAGRMFMRQPSKAKKSSCAASQYKTRVTQVVAATHNKEHDQTPLMLDKDLSPDDRMSENHQIVSQMYMTFDKSKIERQLVTDDETFTEELKALNMAARDSYYEQYQRENSQGLLALPPNLDEQRNYMTVNVDAQNGNYRRPGQCDTARSTTNASKIKYQSLEGNHGIEDTQNYENNRISDKRVFRTQMNGNLLGGSGNPPTERSSIIGSQCELPMKIEKSRLLFLSGDLDDMEVDPGINSPSIGGSPSPVKIEMKLSETHSIRFKRSTIISPSNDETPLQQMRSDCLEEEEAELAQEAELLDEEPQVQIVGDNLEEAVGNQLEVKDSKALTQNPEEMAKMLIESPSSPSAISLKMSYMHNQTDNSTLKYLNQINSTAIGYPRLQRSELQLGSSNSLAEIPNNEADTKEIPSHNDNQSSSRILIVENPQNSSEHPSIIFQNRQEFLFVFGGYSNQNQPVSSYEVLDISSGIWRTFEGDSQKLGQKFFHVTHALPMPGKQIYHLSNASTEIKRFQITEMRTEQLSHEQSVLQQEILPEEFQSLAFSSVQIERGLFLLCGSDGSCFTMYGSQYNPADPPKITTKATMLEPREEFSLALSPCKQFVYAIGGLNSVSIEKYTIATDSWQMVRMRLEHPLAACAVATMPDGIYLMGGSSESHDNSQQSRYSNRVLRLVSISSIGELQIQHMADMKIARCAFTACATGTYDYIYAVGGRNQQSRALSLVERYDVRNNKWEMVAPMASQRYAHAACMATTIEQIAGQNKVLQYDHCQ